MGMVTDIVPGMVTDIVPGMVTDMVMDTGMVMGMVSAGVVETKGEIFTQRDF